MTRLGRLRRRPVAPVQRTPFPSAPAVRLPTGVVEHRLVMSSGEATYRASCSCRRFTGPPMPNVDHALDGWLDHFHEVTKPKEMAR